MIDDGGHLGHHAFVFVDGAVFELEFQLFVLFGFLFGLGWFFGLSRFLWFSFFL